MTPIERERESSYLAARTYICTYIHAYLRRGFLYTQQLVRWTDDSPPSPLSFQPPTATHSLTHSLTRTISAISKVELRSESPGINDDASRKSGKEEENKAKE